MKYATIITSPPAVEPVTLAEAKAHVVVGHTDDDTLLTRLISQARRHVEKRTGRQLITATHRLSLDDFPRCGDRTIRLPVSPVQSVASITYLDMNGVQQTLASSRYRVDTDSLLARITEEYDETWPDTRTVANAVQVSFVAGCGAAGSSVPEDLRGALFLLIGHFYANREAVVGAATSQVLLGVEDILDLYSVRP